MTWLIRAWAILAAAIGGDRRDRKRRRRAEQERRRASVVATETELAAEQARRQIAENYEALKAHVDEAERRTRGQLTPIVQTQTYDDASSSASSP